MEENGPDAKNQKKSIKHDSGAADLERVTDYAEEKEISSDVTGAIATIGERRRKEAQERLEREIELSKVTIRKEDVELMGAVDTAAVAEAVLRWLTDNRIHHTVFARTVLGWNSAFTPMLRKPVPWQQADARARKAYQAMLAWLHQPHQERLDTVKDKQDQMNRKRRTESSHKTQSRQPSVPVSSGGYGLPPDAHFSYSSGGYSEEERSQPGVTSAAAAAGGHLQSQPTQFPGYGLADVPPPSYHDSIQQQQPSLQQQRQQQLLHQQPQQQQQQPMQQPLKQQQEQMLQQQQPLQQLQQQQQPQQQQQQVQQQEQLLPAGDRPPPLYSAPLPGYEELSRSYGPPPPPPQEVSFAQLPPVSEVLQPPSEQPPQLLSPEPQPTPPQRVIISPLQRRALVDIFHVTPWPSPPMRQLIASKLDLPQRTVSNFFSAARSRGVRKRPTAVGAGGGTQPDIVAAPGQQKENRAHVQQ